jgi:hypothetical protein
MIDNKFGHSIGLLGRVKQASLLSNEVHPCLMKEAAPMFRNSEANGT